MALTLLTAIVLTGGAFASATAATLHKVLASPLVAEGSGPDGCTPVVSGHGGPSVWQVRVERLLLDGKGLVEVTRAPDPDRFPLCIADLPVARNATIELSFVVHDGRVARVAGVVMRFVDPEDYYVVEADTLDGTVRFLRVVNGERREIALRSAPLLLGTAQTLEVKAVDTVFAVSLDGKALFEARDNGLDLPGRFGIWSKADSLTVFGDLFITLLD
jgi:hypothetical protein